MTHTQSKDKKFLKRYLKTLQVAHGYPRQVKELLRQAPIGVFKLLSNAAIIASKGNIKLSPKQKKFFRKNRKLFSVLTNRSIGFNKKRNYLIQRGGASAFIPILLSSVIPLVGELLFSLFRNR